MKKNIENLIMTIKSKKNISGFLEVVAGLFLITLGVITGYLVLMIDSTFIAKASLLALCAGSTTLGGVIIYQPAINKSLAKHQLKEIANQLNSKDSSIGYKELVNAKIKTENNKDFSMRTENIFITTKSGNLRVATHTFPIKTKLNKKYEVKLLPIENQTSFENQSVDKDKILIKK